MKRWPDKQLVTGAFYNVRTVGITLPDVEATTKYDGSTVLKVNVIFMTGLATHPSVLRPKLDCSEVMLFGIG
jgi:hypothetical protein